MSISSELTALQQDITNARTAITNKGGTVTSGGGSSQLATDIATIPASSPQYVPKTVTNGKMTQPSGAYTLPSDVTELGNYAMYYAFNNSGITSADLSSLVTINGSSSMYGTFQSSTSLTSVNLSSLVTITGSYPMNYTFRTCNHLASIDVSSLTTIDVTSALRYCFQSCSALTSVTFPSLTTLTGSNCLQYCFQSCTSLTSISFPALTPNSFGSYTNQLNYMLQNVTGCTVHFPITIKNTIGSWSDVTAGFGGTNTTVLFDLNCATLSFSVTPSGTDIYVDGNLLSSTTVGVEAIDTDYTLYNSTLNIILIGTATGLVVGETTTVTKDLSTETTNKLTLATGVTGLSGTITVDGATVPLVEESSGNYCINMVIPSGKTINYFINGGDNYNDESGTITTTGSAITQSITMTPSTTVTFVRPNLTANGTLGGSSFAIAVGSAMSSSYAGYKAVDGDSSTYWWSSSGSSGSTYHNYTIYNPIALKVSSFVLTYSSSSYSAIKVLVNVSNDNSNWTEILFTTMTASTTQTIDLSSNTGHYKYYRIGICPNNSYTRVYEIAVNATYKQ